ncbi:hypothetical protein QQS21_000090 [Conoideocrella luteorostrata]|uniref:superoxide dismutase n=1 Tax=Conoideocrella luteorostrata TaxID=1105319 RepID=A0AAJ0G312_9HYPO|nr:hypothetical protein QQS21_000090 [Conoideocrella luteorostrata]
MLFSAILLAGFSALAAAQTQDAPVTENNPNVIYQATLPRDAFFHGKLDGNVRGSVRAQAGPGGKGVSYRVHFENFPKEGGPFIYHLHVNPVPADGNCTTTLAHLDPYKRGEDPVCDATKPQTCQVGDLSGKYGKVTQDPFHAEYHDPYSSLVENTPGFFGNRSIVVHFGNKTRITCANFQKVDGCAV